MHRYRLQTVYLERDKETGKAKNDTPKGYYLSDERDNVVTKVWVSPYTWIDPDSDKWQEHFERAYFTTPEEAWSAVDGTKSINADTPLYRYSVEFKEPGKSLEYISAEKVDPGETWLTFETIDGSKVMIAMSEVRHFRRGEF